MVWVEAVVFAGNVELVSIVEQYTAVGVLPLVVALKRGRDEILGCWQASDILRISAFTIPIV